MATHPVPDGGTGGAAGALDAPARAVPGFLTGKLVPPDLALATVPRPRLLAALSRDVQRSPLTVITGPAGSGKTALAASWRNAHPAKALVGWLSLDEYDEDPAGFWAYVLAALGRVGVDLGGLEPPVPGEPLPTSFVPRLTSLVCAHPRTTVLVIDNADAVTDRAITAGLDLLVRNAGSRLRLVLCGRADPQLPLHRYRLSGTVSEVRCDQLAFTAEETRDLLRAAGVDATPEVAAELCAQTEGWAAGLRLAAAPLKRGMASERLLSSLVQDDGSVAQYLLAEVLDDQPAGVRRFLLRISVTDDLWPDLVERLAGRSNGRRILAGLARANAFVEQSPGAPGGFRIHSLFREMLRAQLAYEQPEEVARLHRVCATWYASAGLVQTAVDHAVAAGDWTVASQLLIEDLVVGRVLAHESDHAARSLASLPGDLDGAGAAVLRAARAMSLCEGPAPADLVLAGQAAGDPANGPALRASAAVVSVTAAALGGDSGQGAPSLGAADTLVAAVPDGRGGGRHEMAAVLAGARFGLALSGDSPTAAVVTDLGAAAAAAKAVGSRRLRSVPLAYSALFEALAGRTVRAERLVGVAEREGAFGDRSEGVHPVLATALAWAHLDRYELEEAREWTTRAREQRGRADARWIEPLLDVLESRLLRARHEYDEAAETLRAPLDDEGQPRWVREQVVTEAGRARFARSAVPDDRVPGVAGGPVPSRPVEVDVGPDVAPVVAVEAGIARACRWLDDGAVPTAVAELSTALEIAARERLRRPFLDAPVQVRRLLRGRPQLKAAAAWLSAADGGTPVRAGAEEPALLVQDLTEREREVLVHLAGMLSTREIAATMFISVNTVRTHIRSILRKLSATRRNQAVRRARDLGLI